MAFEAARSFGEAVRRRRRALDLTQRALAQRASCTESLIRKIEAEERRPSRELAGRLAEALGIAAAERPLFVQIARGERMAERLALPEAPWAAPAPGSTTAMHRAALPAPTTPLVGRVDELASLARLLADPAIRLVTIVAPGGMGKTRLAIAAAHQADGGRFRDGVAFVDLTPVAAPGQLGAALIDGFALGPGPAGPRARSAWDRALDHLRGKRLLLVLDNAEHLHDTAPFLADLLRTAPGVALLVTSRERLRLHGEQLFPLGGLGIAAEASQLFIQAARRAQPGFAPGESDEATIAAIGRLVEGMPLALELAGAWAALLPVRAIHDEIRRGLDLLATDARDVPERQRSVRAILDATWRRLQPTQRRIFPRLSVFRGGFTRAAGEAVAGAGLRDLATLAEAALVRYDPARDRYSVHELLRQFAAEQLAQELGGEAALEAHGRYYADFLGLHGRRLRDAGQAAALAALAGDQENIAAAWQRAVERRDSAAIAAMADDLGTYHELRADAAAGAMAFGAASAFADGVLLARLLAWWSAFVRLQGEAAEAEVLARRSLASLADSTRGDDARSIEAHTRYRLARALDDQGDAEARAEYAASLAEYRALGRDWEEARGRYNLASLAFEEDRFAEAEREGRACLALRQAGGDPIGIAGALQLLSQVVLATGRLDEALVLARRCHAAFEAIGDRAGMALGLRRLSVVLSWHGRSEEGLPLAERSLALYQDLGMARQIGQAHYNLSLLGATLGEGERAEEHARAAIANDRQLAWLLADDYFALGAALFVQNRDDPAEAALRESLTRHTALGTANGAWAAPLLAILCALHHRHDEAWHLITPALRAAHERHAFMPLLFALSAATLILANEGDALGAVEMFASLERYPFITSNTGVNARLRPRVARVIGSLAPDEAERATERGQARDPWTAAAVLLAGLADRVVPEQASSIGCGVRPAGR